MEEFENANLTIEEGFWVMFYFLQKHYDLSGGNFDISDILSASEPVQINNTKIKVPIDSAMISFWNEAYQKFKTESIPPLKSFMK